MEILKLLSFYITMQLEKVHTRRDVNQKEKAVIDTLQLTSEICSQRHYAGLFKKMREFMPTYFGFEAVGVLVYNQNNKEG